MRTTTLVLGLALVASALAFVPAADARPCWYDPFSATCIVQCVTEQDYCPHLQPVSDAVAEAERVVP